MPASDSHAESEDERAAMMQVWADVLEDSIPGIKRNLPP
jgi:hypothetical protein